MLIGALVMAQIAAAQTRSADSVYATEALRAVVEAAAVANRSAPARLHAYRAHLESEIGLLIVDTLGRERIGQVEQIGSAATWSRDSGYTTHVVGYRSQAAGIPFSMVGLINGWSLPMLYGERLLIGIEGTVEGRFEIDRRGTRRDTVIAVHPFAADRDHYYRYEGGDTVAVLTIGKRTVPLQRIRVRPNLTIATRFAAFDGEIDLDADRQEIVRMRGRFVVNKPLETSIAGRMLLKTTGTVGVAYAEFVNAEYDGRYWLPVTQRIEFQARVALFGGTRSAVRIVSNFSDLVIDDTTESPGTERAYTRRRVTFAPSDSMSAYDGWLTPAGAATASVSADDFKDMAPPQWQADGPPIFSFFPSQPSRVVHYDRVEGLFTGAELSVQMRQAAPGVTARVHGGWAWTERTARGGLSISRTANTTTSAILLDRALVSTADFREDLEDGGSSIAAFFASIEDVDYVDRWSARIAQTRILGSVEHGLIYGRLGVGRDVDVPALLTHGPIRQSVFFLPNRHATTGSYTLASIDYERHPNVTGTFLGSGFGSSLHVEGATGQLSWIRAEASLSTRYDVGPLIVAGRINGGALFSAAPPPQQLFELGGYNHLAGYRYKQFAGDRAAVFGGYALYGLPVYRAPHRIRRWMIPGLSPGFGAGLEGGWTGISNDAAHRAVLALGDGTEANAVSTASGRIRSTASFGVTFFSHTVHFGMARPLDHPAPWRWIVGLGQAF